MGVLDPAESSARAAIAFAAASAQEDLPVGAAHVR